MCLDWLQNAEPREIDQFRAVCNQLLGRTFVARAFYKPERGRVDNPDYVFLTIHYEDVKEYLSFLGWTLQKDSDNGFFYVQNDSEANRCNLNSKETAILLAIRLIYEDSRESLGLDQEAICTVRDLLEKAVTDYAILPAKPNMGEVKKVLAILEKHSVIQRIEGKYSELSCRFVILPTVLVVVSAEKMNSTVTMLQKEEKTNETAQTALAD